MGGDAVLRDAVHLARANLDFEGLPAGTDHGCVQRLVHAVFRGSDVVVELARHRVPASMHYAQRSVAVFAVIDQHAQANDVVNLVQAALLEHHLAVDGINVLGAPRDFGIDASLVQRFQ